MSLAGLKKQFNKANQYISEHVGAADATPLDPEFTAMEQKIDATNELVDDLIARTREYLQPNPATRAKMATIGVFAKARGSAKSMPYPQPEGILGDSFLHHGRALGESSCFGKALIDAGETFKQMADVKYALEDTVKQNYLDPLYNLQSKDLKEVFHHRKKLHGRRLDYDCKKRQKVKDDDLYLAEEKLEESKRLAEQSMYNVLDNEVEEISQLCGLVDAQLDFHRQTTQILESLAEVLKQRVQEASNQPKHEHIPKPVLGDRTPRSKSPVPDTPQMPTSGGGGGLAVTPSHQDPWSNSGGGGGGTTPVTQDPWGQPPPSYSSVNNNANPTSPLPQRQQACCKALFDFDAENEGELSFREGNIINLTSRIDENWFEGRLPNGTGGFFPVSYVEVMVPLP